MTHGWTDALVRYFELIAKIDISHIATAEQRGRYQNLLDLRASGEYLNGHPQRQDLGTRNEFLNMQEQWRKDMGIELIPNKCQKAIE